MGPVVADDEGRQRPAVDHPVPVVSCRSDALDDVVGWRNDVERVLAQLATGKSGAQDLTVWAREDVGYDGNFDTTLLLYLYVVSARNSSRVALALATLLGAAWQTAFRQEGQYSFVGGERAIASLVGRKVVQHD